MNKTLKMALASVCAAGFAQAAVAQIPGLPSIGGFGQPAKKDNNTAGKIAGAGAGCVVGGGAGYFATKALGGFLRDQGMTNKEVNQAAVLVAGVGCVVGGKVALEIIQNMDEKSKQKQEEAWAQAQAQTGPVAWEGPDGSGYSGTTELIEPETMPDGKACATRKDYVVKASAGDAEAYTRVCKNDSGDYVPVET